MITMGRKAGHLALGIGKAAGATLTLIPEEFPKPLRLKTIVDTLVGAIIKRLSYGRRDGVAMIAEGVVLDVEPNDLSSLHEVERDAHGNLRIAEVNIGEILKAQVAARLKELGMKATLVAKNIGYELRCADPIPYDMEYTRDLGYCAAKFLLAGGNAAMISMQGGHFVPIPFVVADRQRDRPRSNTARGYPFHPLRHRAPLHDPLAPRRFRGSARAGEVRRDGRHVARRVPPAVRVSRRGRAAAAHGGLRRRGQGGRSHARHVNCDSRVHGQYSANTSSM